MLMMKTIFCVLLIISINYIILITSRGIGNQNDNKRNDISSFLPSQHGLTVFYEGESDRTVEILSNSNKKIVECYLHGDKELAGKALMKKKISPIVKKVKRSDLRIIINACSEFLFEQSKILKFKFAQNTSDFPDEYNNQLDRGFFEGLTIYPGTKWCGAGDIAENYDDLGTEVETDMCCRDHDHCFDAIPKGQTKYNLTNKAIHTKSHCECDESFKECLIFNGIPISDRVGKLYFNLIQVQCFKEDHPQVKCLGYKGYFDPRIPFFWKSCQDYELDYSQPPMYQFFDARWYEILGTPEDNLL